MKKVAILLIMVTLAFAGVNPKTAVSKIIMDNPDMLANSHPATSTPVHLNYNVAEGTVDTIGGTTYDWQWNYMSLPRIVVTANYIFVYWMRSPDETFADRHMYYNVYLKEDGEWFYPVDPSDYMNAGSAVFPNRDGYGTIDITSEEAAVVSAHYLINLGMGDEYRSHFAKEALPATATWDIVTNDLFPPDFIWPRVVVDNEDNIHMLSSGYQKAGLYYSYYDGSDWSDPDNIAGNVDVSQHFLAASKAGSDIAASWHAWPEGERGFVNITTGTNDGSFEDPEVIDFDHMITLTDDVPSHAMNWLGHAYLYYDYEGKLHTVGRVLVPYSDHPDSLTYYYAYFAGIAYRDPDGEWHPIDYNEMSTTPDTLQPLPKGQNPFESPSVTVDPSNGYVYVVYQKYDLLNRTEQGYHQSDIYVACSKDGGKTWEDTLVNITQTDNVWEKYPNAVAYNDTLYVLYMVDLDPATFVLGGGGSTPNPMILQKVPQISKPFGIEEKDVTVKPEVSFTINNGGVDFQIKVDRGAKLSIFDVMGREVKSYNFSTGGEYNVRWEGPAGYYFYSLDAGNQVVTGKIVNIH